MLESRELGTSIHLRLLRDRKEKNVIAILGSPPTSVANIEVAPSLLATFDTGGHRGLIRTVIFTPDGSSLISVGDDKQIRIWDLKTGNTVRIIRGNTGAGREGQVLAIALSPDGTVLAAAGWLTIPGAEGYHIRLYDFRTGELKGLLTGGHTERIGALAFSPDGRLLISGGHDKTAVIWDVQSKRELYRLAWPHGGNLRGYFHERRRARSDRQR